MKVLFVILDTLRRDFLEPYGSDWVHTPNIQRLAQRSVVCDNHWVGSLPCMPARREFMTGRHNFLERGWGPLEPFDDVLPALLRSVGPGEQRPPVFSHLITDHYHYFYLGGEGHNNSFDTWQFERGQESDFWISRVDLPALPPSMNRVTACQQNALNRMAQREEHEFSGPRCIEHAVRWLDDNRGSDNWLLQVELFDPHEPFYVVPKYLELYGDTWDGPLYDWPDYGVCADSPEAIEHIRKCYAALLTMTDHWLGRLWDKLDELDAWRDTVVVLTTDHGSMLGEHQYWMKNAMPVYNEIAHIPLIVHLPGSARAGTRVSALTQTTDLMPTMLDWFNAPPPPHVHGTSLRPALEAGEAVHDSIIYGYFGMALNATDGPPIFATRSPPRRCCMPTRPCPRSSTALCHASSLRRRRWTASSVTPTTSRSTRSRRWAARRTATAARPPTRPAMSFSTSCWTRARSIQSTIMSAKRSGAPLCGRICDECRHRWSTWSG